MDEIEKLCEVVKSEKNIVFFGGAGVSTESGIPDFRSSNGIYSKKINKHFTPEQLISHTFYEHYPEDFFEFYKKNLIYSDAKPNICHQTLAKLEKLGKLNAVVTQNIDGLHQKAGSKTVYELHGSVLRNYCENCNKFFDENYILNGPNIPKCDECGGRVKPDVVLYEESLNQNTIQKSIEVISLCSTLIIGGTSLIVYPAAGLIDYFHGKNLILINKTATSSDYKANIVIHESLGIVFNRINEII